MLIPVGKESEYTKEELRPLDVETDLFSGKVTKFPKVDYGWHVACAYNQFGMDGMAKMFICQTLDDMNELVRNYNNGGALKISWCTMPDTHFVKIMTIDEWKQSSEKAKKTRESMSNNSAFFEKNNENTLSPSRSISRAYLIKGGTPKERQNKLSELIDVSNLTKTFRP